MGTSGESDYKIMLKLQYFASIREQLNKSEETVVFPEEVNDISDLIEYMKNNNSDFNKLFEKERKVSSYTGVTWISCCCCSNSAI